MTRQPSRRRTTPRTRAGLTLTPIGSVNDGNGGNNYSATFLANTTGQITVRPLTVTAVSRAYDGTTTATVDLASNMVATDAVALSDTSATFADKNPACQDGYG